MLKRLLLLLFFVPTVSLAVALGPVTVDSYLYQPLQAVVPLKDLGNVKPIDIKVGLASNAEFAKADLSKTALIQSLHFQLRTPAGQEPFIVITSTDRITEPYLSFLIHLNWFEGEYVKKYTLLLDPAPIKPVPAAMDKNAQVYKPVERHISNIQNDIYGPTKLNQTLWQVAKEVKRVRPKASIDQIMLALAEYNPHAFLNHNVNGLMSGYFLRIPTIAQIKVNSPVKAENAMHVHNKHWSDKSKTPLNIRASQPPVTVRPVQQALPLEPGPVIEEPASTQTTATAPETRDAEAVQTKAEPSEKLQTLQQQLSQAQQQNQTMQSSNASLQQRLQELQTENENLKQELTGTKASVERLQKLIQTQAQTQMLQKNKKGFMSTVLQKWWQIIAVILVIVIIILWIVVRRKRKAEAEDDFTPPTNNLKTKHKVAADPDLNDENLDLDTEADIDKPQINITTAAERETKDDVNMQGLLPDVTVEEVRRKNPGVNTEAATSVDLIQEAKLYIEYDRPEQALEMLQSAADKTGDDVNLWEQLLQTGAELKDKKAFGSLVAKIPAELLNPDKQGLWQVVERLRAGLESASTEEHPTPTVTEEPMPETEENDDIDLQPLDADEVAMLEDAEPELTKQDDKQDVTAFDMDDGLKLTDDDLDITVEKDEPQMPSDIDLIAGEDNDATKLDLARAYIEMGDNNNAKKILHEVVKFGKPDAKQQAQSLLDELKE